MAGGTRSVLSAKPSQYENFILVSLSLASGCMDVLSYLSLGDVFTSAMTGNTALLAIAIGHGSLLAASRSLCALVAFILGVVLATMLHAGKRVDEGAQRGLGRILLVELLFLGAGALLWSTAANPIPLGRSYVIIALSALGMGIQAVGAYSINSVGISTIVFTTGLIRIVAAATGTLARRTGTTRIGSAHLPTFAAYGVGAVLAALFIADYAKPLLWLPVAAVSSGVALSVLAERSKRASA